jgi:hypothetical protein
LAQITKYDWINAEQMERAIKRLEKTIEHNNIKPSIETTIIHQSQETAHEPIDKKLAEYFELGHKFRFTARTDIITESTIWEIKCTKEITMDHQLQVVIYAWLYRHLYPETNKHFKIYNIKTNEIQELDATDEELDYIVVSLLQGKYEKNHRVSDEEFVETCSLNFANQASTLDNIASTVDLAVGINGGCL